MIIVWDASRDRFLLGTDGNSLPVLPGIIQEFGGDVPTVVARELGVEGFLLDVVVGVPNIYVMAATNAGPAPDALSWVTGDIAAVAVVFPPARAWLKNRHVPSRPWFAPAWHEDAVHHLTRVVESQGARVSGRPEQVRHWPLSSVMRLPSSAGNFYLKTVPETDVYEPDLVSLIREWDVPVVPPYPVAVDHVRRSWISTEHAGVDGAALMEPRRSRSVTALAQVQQAAMLRLDDVMAIGVSREDLHDLANLVPQLMARDDLWSARSESYEGWRGLTDGQARQWRGLGSWLADQCHQLAELTDQSAIQPSLVHGDFHPGNTMHHEENVIIHDWAFARVGHPFIDLGTWIDDMSVAGARADLDRYFGSWAGYADISEIASIWRAAKPVSGLVALDRAIRLTEEIGQVRRGCMIAVVYGWVRRLLGAAADGDATIANWPPPP